MKLIFMVFAISLMPIAAYSTPSENVVQTMAKQTGLSPQVIRDSYAACDSGVTLTMKICGGYQLTEQDIRLNQLYKQALAKVKELGLKASLVRAQRAWLVYRDAQCPFEGAWTAEGGTAEGLYIISCKIDLTKQQADRLDAIVRE